MTRAEHLQWAKDRAVQYLPDHLDQALASFLSDIRKWDGGELINSNTVTMLAPLAFMAVANNDAAEMRRWIEGFN